MTCATASLISYLSSSYLLAKLFELLIHRLCSPKCVVAEISVCSDISFPLKELPNEKIRVEKIELELIMSDVAIRYLGALIFFANLKKIMFTVCRAGTFYLSTNI